MEWIKTVDLDDAYWEKGMTVVPSVVYALKDKLTYELVLRQFGIELSATGSEV